MRHTGHDNQPPIAGNTELCRLLPSLLKKKVRAGKAVRPLRQSRRLPRQVLPVAVDVAVAGKKDERIGEQTCEVVARQSDAAVTVGIGSLQRRQRVPTGIGGADRLEQAVRLLAADGQTARRRSGPIDMPWLGRSPRPRATARTRVPGSPATRPRAGEPRRFRQARGRYCR